MHAQLVAGSGSDDFAELVLHLLHYDSRQRWTVTQALQEPCTQAINAACGYPSTVVPMPNAFPQSSGSAGMLLSMQSSSTSMSEDINVFSKEAGFSEFDNASNAEQSPRIASVPRNIAQQFRDGQVLSSDSNAVVDNSSGFNWSPLFGSYNTVQPAFEHSNFASSGPASFGSAVSPAGFGQEIPARGGLDVDRMFGSELAAVPNSSDEASSDRDVDSDAAMLLPSNLMDELDATPAMPALSDTIHQAVASVNNHASETAGSADHAAQICSQLSLSLSSALSSDAADSNVDKAQGDANGSLDAAGSDDDELEAGGVDDVSSDASSDVSSDVSSEDDSDEFEAQLEAAFKAAHQLHEIEGIPAVFQTAGRPICQLAVGKFYR